MTKTGPGDIYQQITLFAVEAFEAVAAAPTKDSYWDEITDERHATVDSQLSSHAVDNFGEPLDAPEQVQEHFTVSDRWNPAHFGEVPRKLDADGNPTIFWDDTEEPPDPDDYSNLEEYHQAWEEWQAAHVLEQDTKNAVPEQKNPCLDATTEVPEHIQLEFLQWVEQYRPSTRKGHLYYRYCWKEGRKIHHMHIAGGNTRSQLAGERKKLVENAIASGRSPREVSHLIKSWKCDRTSDKTH